ncbi:acyltransferase [Thermomonas sp.]|uniref:acyltransferase family protein n=1 Tax=Thermomonas sp. TaxID=1971895 RepID=UPI002639AB67|nr:acyltransferase [Thermomonas sp.]MCO5054637.1 acyltransferase [Thermomonas sp.]
MAERKLEWIEVMRGGAALWVLLHHAKQSVDHFVSNMGPQPWFEHGYFGVDFFFVLSGFIIAFAAQRMVERGRGLSDYAKARVIRIYVPYLPVGIAMYFLYLLLPGMSESDRSPSVLTSLTLFPDNQPPALSVAWTLVHEMMFYVLYSIFFVGRRSFRIIFCLWAVAILFFYWQGVVLPLAARYLLSPINLCFVLGVVIFQTNRRVQVRGFLLLPLVLIGVGLVIWQTMTAVPNRILVAAGFGCMVWAAASPVSAKLMPWRWLMALGAASYSVYLVHNPLLSFLVRLVPQGVSVGIAYCAISATALAGGMAYWYFYERPMLVRVRNWVNGWRRAETGTA